MTDLSTRFRSIETNTPPDLWQEIIGRDPRPDPSPSRRGRIITIVVASVVAAAGLWVGVLTFAGTTNDSAGAGAAPILYEVRASLEDDSAVWSIQPDGSDAHLLYDSGGAYPSDQTGIWAPDGRSIAIITGTEDADPAIVIVRPDGAEISAPLNGYCVASLAWAADGRSLVFVGGPLSDGVCPESVWDLDLQTGDTALLADGWFFDVDVSPDGRSLLMVKAVQRGNETFSELWLSDRDGSNAHPITSDGGVYLDASWSPDGRRIATSWEPEGDSNRYDIYVMDADGSAREQLTRYGSDGSSVWSPDGNQIAFTTGRDAVGNAQQGMRSVYVMDADGTNQHQLVEGRTYAIVSSWG